MEGVRSGDRSELKQAQKTVYRERAWLVGMVDTRADPRDGAHLDELENLAETAGAVVVGRTIQKRERPDPSTYVGSGKVVELSRAAREHKIDVLIFDHDLSPAQVRTLEKEIDAKVIDRTELILDIFATHARSKQAKLQVELAQLEYTLPRLRRMWTHITGEQQAGGVGIGQRGPGEQQIESDRRIAKKRVTGLKREIAETQKRKQREVEARTAENFTVSLVGYTNAGKSSMMNALTGAGVLVDNRLFSTLDTRTRLWILESGIRLLLSDTVGFIRNLPHDLVTSFHATLEEVAQADLLLHVVDSSHPEAEEQIAAVEGVLKQLRCKEATPILLFNKVDLLKDPVELTLLKNRHPNALFVSAATGAGLEELNDRVYRIVTDRLVEIVADIPHSDGRLLAELAVHAVVMDKEFVNEHTRMRIRVPQRLLWKLEKFRVPSA